MGTAFVIGVITLLIKKLRKHKKKQKHKHTDEING